MPWKALIKDLALFSNELAGVSATELTAIDLQKSHSLFHHQWKEGSVLESEEDGIYIPPPRKKALHPTQCDPKECRLKFSFKLGALTDNDTWLGPRKAAFTVCVKGLYRANGIEAMLEDHWRIDTHEYEEGSVEPHPLVHFQRGGHAQDQFAQLPGFVPGDQLPLPTGDRVWRGLMQSPAPRIPIPPMCPILAIDFTIAQHDGNVWSELRRREAYRALIDRAQERLWLPYFEALNDKSRRARWIGPLLAD